MFETLGVDDIVVIGFAVVSVIGIIIWALWSKKKGKDSEEEEKKEEIEEKLEEVKSQEYKKPKSDYLELKDNSRLVENDSTPIPLKDLEKY